MMDDRKKSPGTLRVLALVVILAAGSGAAAPASAQDLLPSGGDFWAVSGGAFLGALLLDERLRRDPGQRDPALGHLADAAFVVGGRQVVAPALAAGLIVSGLTGWPANAERMGRATAGVLAAVLVSESVKSTVGRGRPRAADHPRRFRPLTRENEWMSLPSGHATTGFALATAFAKEFDLGLAEPLAYVAAGIIAWSRIYDDAHWASDAVLGAVIGILVARTVVAALDGGAEHEETAATRLAAGAPIVLQVRLR